MAKLIRNKKSLYEACGRNEYYLPPYSDGFISADFLNGVRTGENWLPKTSQCKVFTCIDPPSREEIATTLRETIQNYVLESVEDEATKQKYLNTATRIQKHPPNKTFSLTLLGNFQPNHIYFSKDYQKPKKYKETQLVYQVDNSDDFFTNLPPCKPSKKNSIKLGMT